MRNFFEEMLQKMPTFVPKLDVSTDRWSSNMMS